MRVLLASPSYGPVDPICREAIDVAIMSAANHGTHWMGTSYPDRMFWTEARNNCVEACLGMPECEGIVWVDSDMVPKPETFWRLMDMVEKQGFDFLSGIYHARRGHMKPVFFHYNKKLDIYSQAYVYEKNVVFPVDAVGFGICFTSRKALEKIASLKCFNKDEGGWFPDQRWSKWSEDITFGNLAMKAGIRCYLDTGNIAGHMGILKIVWPEDYWATFPGVQTP